MLIWQESFKGAEEWPSLAMCCSWLDLLGSPGTPGEMFWQSQSVINRVTKIKKKKKKAQFMKSLSAVLNSL